MKKTFLIASILLVAASLSAKQYPDSIQQASKEEPNIAYGWNFEFAGGLGVGGYEYKQLFASFSPGYDHHVSNKFNFPAWNAAVGISYYFVPWMGIGTGAQFSAYTNKAAVTVPWTQAGTDTYGDNYTITATPTELNEIQNIYMLEIPIALKFRARPGVCGFTATAGVKLGLPMMNNYHLKPGGYMDNSVHYPLYDLTLKDVPTVVENINIPEAKGEMEKTAFRTLNYAAYAEIGMLIRVHQRVELAISAFGNYYFTDLLTHETPAYGTTPLGFGAGQSCGEYDMPYNTAYNGVLRTQEVETLHPWSAGLKLGIQINANRTKAQRDYDREQRKLKKAKKEEKPKEEPKVEEPVEEPVEQPAPPQPDPRELALQRIKQIAAENNIDICKELCAYMHDTIYIGMDDPSLNKDAVKKLDDELQQAIIYFNLDEAKPILEPEDILVRIANILKNHPDQKVRVNGHACKLGKPEYNKHLAMRRAKAVAGMLRELGVAKNQMIIASLGADVPYRYNGQHQLSKDRRVEIVPTGRPAETKPAASTTATSTPARPATTQNLAPTRTTEIVRPGSRLAQIARRYYKETEFWVFIYEANRDKIQNPSRLPAGLEIRIPDLTERLKGMTHEQALEEAARLKQEYLKK